MTAPGQFHPITLIDLGWDEAWAASFATVAEAGWFPGRVARVDRNLVTVLTPESDRAVPLSESLTTGDWVALGAADSGSDLLQVKALLPRRSAFKRSRAGEAAAEQLVAANVDVTFLLQALDRGFNPRLVERYLTLAWESGATPVVILSKADRRSATEVAAVVDQTRRVAIGVEVVVVSSTTGAGLEELTLRWLRPGTTAAVMGPSGAGKSTLVNRMAGRDRMATAAVRADGKGRHTTSHRELVVIPGRGILLDTPGMRSLGLWLSGDGLDRTFADLQALATRCRFSDCAHQGEPGCAVAEAVAGGVLPSERLEAWRKLERELESVAARQGDLVAQQAQRERWRRLTREQRRQR